MKQYRYDAFISYRHTELDIFAAENLHKMMEAFRLPGNVARKKKGGRTRINRIFRDKDELPLTSNLEDPIKFALNESEYLIVICSPRLRESLWCKKEVETFISLHGRDKVLAVLIEGEPEESFPEALLFPAEPLAADIRGKDKHAIKKAMRTEVFRLLAPMFELGYDDLRQRHRERRLKKILAASVIGASICLVFGAVSTVMALRIQKQKEQIEVQSREINHQNMALLENQALNLAEISERQLEDGDRIGAIKTAVDALTTYNSISMPYTPKAQLSLTESLRVYDNDSYIKPVFQLETAGVIDFMKLSGDRKTLLTYDNTDCITLWNVISGEIITEIRNVGIISLGEDECIFLGSNRLVYKNAEGKVDVFSIQQKKVLTTLETGYVDMILSDPNEKYLIIKEYDHISVYDTDAFTKIYVYQTDPNYEIDNHLYINEEATILAFQESIEDGSTFLRFLHLQDGSLNERLSIGFHSIVGLYFRDDLVYTMMNDSIFDINEMNTTLAAFQISSSKKVWEVVYENSFGYDIYGPRGEGADKMLFLTGGEAYLIDENDGSQYAYFSLGIGVAGVGVYNQSDIYVVFTRDGEYHNIFVKEKQDYVFVGQFQCHSQNVKEFLISAENYLVLPYMDNRVTVYDYSTGPDLEEYTGTLAEMQEDYLSYTDAVNAAEQMDLPKSALARYAFYNEDESMMFVVYSDNSMEIYSTAENKVLSTMSELEDEPRYYLGEDKAGHFYISGISYGYMLDKNCNVVGIIEGLIQVNKEDNKLVVKDTRGYNYTMPIYTVEELLAKAESYVLR